MPEENPVQMKSVKINGVELYAEVRGKGPAILFISGIGGDAGYFKKVADKLANDFTTITYDHRGQSRSYRAKDWYKTSVAEMADDAAEILKDCGVKTATIFGTDIGGLIALEMAQRHPKLLRKAIIHDPIIYHALNSSPYQSVLSELGGKLRAKFVTQGAPAALATLLSDEIGSKAFNLIDPITLMRLMANGEVFVMMEFPAYAYYKPDESKISAIKTPITILSSTTSAPYFREMSTWLGKQLHIDPIPFLGVHAPYLETPLEMVEALRNYL
jgi:pimeloyl-ACP methyl ester carboxylesterase